MQGIGVLFFFFMLLFTMFSVGDLMELNNDGNNHEKIEEAPANSIFHSSELFLSQRAYAYITAFLVMIMFGAIVYCHVLSVRRARLLEQYAQQGILPEWSPLLIERKNIRPPPPYEQVV